MVKPDLLLVQVFWGHTGTFINSFTPEDGPVRAQAADDAAVPLWGVPGAEAAFTLAEPTAEGYRVHVPAGATVERAGAEGPFLAEAPGQRALELVRGHRVRFTLGNTRILVAVEAPPVPFQRQYERAILPVLVLLLTFVFPVYFLIAYHTESNPQRLANQDLWRAANEGMPELIRPGDPISPADASAPFVEPPR